jgi:hypothetical protein
MEFKFAEMERGLQEVANIPLEKERKRQELIRKLVTSEEWVMFPCLNNGKEQQIIHKRDAEWYVIKNTLYMNGRAAYNYKDLAEVTSLIIYKKRYLMFFHDNIVEVVDTETRWQKSTRFEEQINALCVSGSVVMVGFVSSGSLCVTFTEDKVFKTAHAYYEDEFPVLSKTMCNGDFVTHTPPALRPGRPLRPNAFIIPDEEECGQICSEGIACPLHDGNDEVGDFVKKSEKFDIHARHAQISGVVARRILRREQASAEMQDVNHQQV